MMKIFYIIYNIKTFSHTYYLFMKSIYDFTVKDADLYDFSFEEYKNKVLLVVNVASYCGLTFQYKGLEKLYKKYKAQGFEIAGFPCNQFALQEPGTNEQIKNFCYFSFNLFRRNLWTKSF